MLGTYQVHGPALCWPLSQSWRDEDKPDVIPVLEVCSAVGEADPQAANRQGMVVITASRVEQWFYVLFRLMHLKSLWTILSSPCFYR